MQIYGLNKTTLLDYPGLVASTVFTGSCNFRCPFCQNADLVLNPFSQPLISQEEVFSHFDKRKSVVKGVCITGGEPTLQKDLIDFIRKLKEKDLKVKLDTNGYQPDVIKIITEEKLVDYFAMDIKSALATYDMACGIICDTKRIEESIRLIMNSGIDYEFRTTVVRELHNEDTFKEIAETIRGAKQYFLQGYKDSERVIERRFSAYSKEEMLKFVPILSKNIEKVAIRGLD